MTELKSWIKMVKEDEAEGVVAEAYENFRKRLNWIPKDTAILSIKPKMLQAFHSLSMEMRSTDNKLNPTTREQIAFLTSVINKCTY